MTSKVFALDTPTIKDLTNLMVLPKYYQQLDQELAQKPPCLKHQTLHFVDKSIETDALTLVYVREKMNNAQIVESDAHNMEVAISLALEKDKQLGGCGIFAEFGIGLGKSGNFIAQHIGSKTLYGFDWYKGLPEDWRAPHFLKGTFAVKPGVKIPPLPLEKNIEFIIGLFKQTLPGFLKEKNTPILFMHIDCDLYSSTKEIFDNIKDNIVEGTVIVFDEYFNYDGWQDYEFRAFQEFIRETGFTYEYVCYNRLHQQVAVKIVSTNKAHSTNVTSVTLKIENKCIVPSPKGFLCHALSGIKYQDSFIFAYYAGQTSYQHGGVAMSVQNIYITRGNSGHWQEPAIVATPNEVQRNNQACFDPVLFETDGRLYLFYRIGKSPRDWSGFVKVSDDAGVSWSKAIALPLNYLGPAKCKPLITKNGKNLICGSSTQRENGSISKKFNEPCGQDGWVSVDILENFKNIENFSNQQAWNKGKAIGYELRGPGSVVIQPAIWHDQGLPDMLHMLCRSNRGKLVYSCSHDNGLTWAFGDESELPSNYSAIDIVQIKQGIFMAWNPLEKPLQGDARWKLVLSRLALGVAPGLVNAWKDEVVLEEDVTKQREYSFPTIITSAEGLFVAYACNRQEIRLAKIAIQ